jgi:hypothetical protein
MAADFGNFSPQSFERLIQALCIHVLGPGTAIFGSGPDGAREATFEGEVPLALARDLRNERDVRLREAGQETDKSLFLESVFVDLPALTPYQDESDKQDETPEPLDADQRLDTTRRDEIADSDPEDAKGVNKTDSPHRIVGQIFRRAADKLDPDSLTASWGKVRRRPARNRIVVLGGPGQGKSTIGQFLAQVARARLLSTHEPSHLNPQTHELIDPILNRARVEEVPLDGPFRFPVRIELPAFADAPALSTAAG